MYSILYSLPHIVKCTMYYEMYDSVFYTPVLAKLTIIFLVVITHKSIIMCSHLAKNQDISKASLTMPYYRRIFMGIHSRMPK